jgi:hypothetical protein
LDCYSRSYCSRGVCEIWYTLRPNFGTFILT